ncbi:hypothetical protein, partial [Mesorhizobium sp. M0674]
MALFSIIAGFLGRAKAQKRRFSNMAEFRELVIAEFKRQPGVDSAVADPSDPAKIGAKLDGAEVTADVTNVFGHLNSYPDEDADAAIRRLVRGIAEIRPRCLIPGFDGAYFSSESKDALWARFFMGAPRR